MNFLEKYLTRKNLFYVTLVTGGLSLIAFLCLITVNVNDILFSNSGLGSLLTVTYLFQICFILNIILAGGIGYLKYYKKREDKVLFIIFILTVAALVLQLFSIGFISDLQKMISAINSNDFFGAASVDTMSMYKNLNLSLTTIFGSLLLDIAAGIYFGYLVFIKKNSLSDDITSSDTTGTGIDIDVEALKENASIAKDLTAEIGKDAVGKVKEFASTKKGKNILIGCACVLILIVAYSIYASNKKTEFDATRGCEIVVEGISGDGVAYVTGCDLDYDITNSDISLFASNLQYEIKGDGNFKNGDTVKAVAKYSEETAKSLKLDVVNTTITTKVKGLLEYYDSLKEIPKKILNDADKKITDYIKNVEGNVLDDLYFSDLSRDKDIKITNKTLLGKYYMNADDDSWYYTDSIVYLYKMTFSGEERTSYLNDTFEPAEETKYVYLSYNEVSSNAIENASVGADELYDSDGNTEEVIDKLKEIYDGTEIEEIK